MIFFYLCYMLLYHGIWWTIVLFSKFIAALGNSDLRSKEDSLTESQESSLFVDLKHRTSQRVCTETCWSLLVSEYQMNGKRSITTHKVVVSDLCEDFSFTFTTLILLIRLFIGSKSWTLWFFSLMILSPFLLDVHGKIWQLLCDALLEVTTKQPKLGEMLLPNMQ